MAVKGGLKQAIDRIFHQGQIALFRGFAVLDFLLKPHVLIFESALEGPYSKLMLNAGQDFLDLEGLHDVVHAAHAKSRHFINDRIQRADENNRNIQSLRIGLKSPTDFVTVHPRHHHVKEDEIGLDGLGTAEGERTINGIAHFIPLLAQGRR